MEDHEKLQKSIKITVNVVLMGAIFLFSYQTYNLLKNLKYTHAYIVAGIVAVVAIFYYNYRIHKKIFDILDRMEMKRDRISREKCTIREFLKKDLTYMSSEELSKLINTIDGRYFLKESTSGQEDNIQAHLEKAKRALELQNYEKRINTLEYKKGALEQEIKDIEEQKYEESLNEEVKQRRIKTSLDIYKNHVYPISSLNTEQRTILKEEGYKQINEYDITEKKIITALVNPPMEHSKTHTFLVWSTKKYLKTIENIEKIQEHETRDADITFKYVNRIYAIEIETGNLLKKQKQLTEKINYLNKKYPKRWFFIVSNRNLQTQYKKYGISTQRNRVSEIIQKILKI